MTDLALLTALNNAAISAALALLAWTVHRSGKHPRLAHLLWVLVLAKLLTPPIWSLPVVEIAWLAPATSVPALGLAAPVPLPVAPVGLVVDDLAAGSGWTLPPLKSSLLSLWLLGSALVLVTSLWRIARFDRLLKQACRPAPGPIQQAAAELAARLGLESAPAVYRTSADLSPMVWWVGGAVRVVVPDRLVDEMTDEQLRWIIGHELAHVRRGDHLVRWLEWLACVAFWWNPVAWWARRHLRASEELCCDALVLGRLSPEPTSYASSLLTAVELLAAPALRPPAMASEINSGGFLERRFRMIVKGRTAPASRGALALVLLCAIGLLPLSVAFAQDPDYDAVTRRLIEAVEAGELSAAQAEAMMGALARKRFAEQLAARSGERHHDEPHEEHLAKVQHYLEEAGLRGERLEAAAAAVVKLAHTMREHGKKADYAGFKKYFAELKLTDRQHAIVWELATKLAGAKREESAKVKPLTDHEIVAVKNKLAAAVKAGELTEQQAKEKLNAYIEARKKQLDEIRDQMRKRAAVERKIDARKRYEEYEARIKAAVEAGKLSEAEARRALADLKQRLFGDSEKKRR